ncbi:MAG TPA: hypothetical protein VM366_11145 [Anaerolineae bacterium]|nr:hypothetical protein [Anaerolineae bacterium]
MLRLFYYLSHGLFSPHSRMVPDQAWLGEHWMDLIHAREWNELAWFPAGRLHGKEQHTDG